MPEQKAAWWKDDQRYNALQWRAMVTQSDLHVLEGAVIEGTELIGPWQGSTSPVGDGINLYLKTKDGRCMVLSITHEWDDMQTEAGVAVSLTRWD